VKYRNPIKPVIVTRKHYWPHLSALLVLALVAGTLEYRDVKAAAEEAERQFIECLRGEWKTTTAEGDETMCYPVEVLKKEDRK
jgi:hypothetical protein